MIGQAAAPLRRRKDARPRELLSAAMSLFVQKGFAATRTDEIAERAGVSKGTLYLYFDHKEALFTALVAESFFCEFPFESAPHWKAGKAARSFRTWSPRGARPWSKVRSVAW